MKKLTLLFESTNKIIYTSYEEIIEKSEIESKNHFVIKQALDEMVKENKITILRERLNR